MEDDGREQPSGQAPVETTLSEHWQIKHGWGDRNNLNIHNRPLNVSRTDFEVWTCESTSHFRYFTYLDAISTIVGLHLQTLWSPGGAEPQARRGISANASQCLLFEARWRVSNCTFKCAYDASVLEGSCPGARILASLLPRSALTSGVLAVIYW